ncbi:MAG: ABC transporter permease [Saprospiraceae bacterium]
MLKNHLKIAFRQIKKQKFYSSVNIIGLAIGVTCCLLIALFIKDELSYDQHHPNVENLYRVARNSDFKDYKGIGAAGPPIMASTLVDEIPEIKKAARINPHFYNAGNNIIRKAGEKEGFYEDGFVYADQELFELFDLPLISGDQKTILKEPYNIVITEKIAKKYFQNENPVGKTLIFNNEKEQTYTITGVMENIRDQSHFHYDFFMSLNTLDNSKSTTWVWNNYYTYVTLEDGTTPEELEAKLENFVVKNFAPQYKSELNTDLAELVSTGRGIKMVLQPVTDIHLRSTEYTQPYEPQGDIKQVKIFGIIALFILLIALVNFVNLSTARSANRAKEVGLRKVLGSHQKQLVSQFLSESILMSAAAFLIGTGVAFTLMPLFNDLSGKSLNIPFLSIGFIPVMLGSAVLIGVLAGLYPSFYLSAFEPVKVLKGKLSTGNKSGMLRSGLVVFQFAISIGLIVGTMVVYQQMSFIKNKHLGFEKEQVLLIEDTNTIFDQLPAFKDAIKKLPEAKNATISSYLPLDGGRRNSVGFFPKGKPGGDDLVIIQRWSIDEDYFNTLGMNLIKGRNFKQEMLTDTLSIILNETAVRSFGFTENPIGQILANPFDDKKYTVIGVVEDFNFDSLKGKVADLGFFMGMSSSVVSVKTTAVEMDKLIAKTETVWKSFAPTQPFRYDFLDDRFAKMYIAEDRIGKLFSIFSILAIFIACLGLLALATFMTEQRMKEIGIRKVLGASIPNIVFTLSKSFLLYVIIGLLIAAPIAWLQMSEWLNGFEYRIEMEWWMIVLAGLLAVVIAFTTVGLQSLRAALSNPMESLRSE